MRELIIDAAKKAFRPEFLNRLDDVIVFRALVKKDLGAILDLELHKVTKRLKEKDIDLVLNKKAHDLLVEKGYDPEYGARPMRRAVEWFLEDPLAEEILRGSLIGGEPIKVSAKDDKLTFKQKASTETEEETVSASE